MARVYISSTYADLTEYRLEVLNTLRRMQQEVIAMEDYAAADERPLVKCLADVERCDYYVGIFAMRYGFVPPNDNGDNPAGKSITELEYRHAVKTAKKCFIFLVHEKARWPIEYIEKGAGVEKLKVLCEELKLNHSVGFFKSEDDLANEVSAAIVQHILPASTQNLGKLPPFAHWMCDRDRQTKQFKRFFESNLRTRPGVPQICFVQGEKGECHNSLVKRLSVTEIKAAADDPKGCFSGVMDADKVPKWVDDGNNLEELKQDLLAELFRQFADPYRDVDLSATALSKLAGDTQKRLIVLKHTIHAADCNDMTWELIKWCLSYWAEMVVDISRPQFIIFFNIIYPKSEPSGRFTFWRVFTRFNKKPIKDSLDEVSTTHNAGLPCLLLDELPPVRQKHVEDWFTEYEDKGGFSLGTRQDVLRGLFRSDEDVQKMEEVELALERLVKAYGR